MSFINAGYFTDIKDFPGKLDHDANINRDRIIIKK
jgi:hypothetical protein